MTPEEFKNKMDDITNCHKSGYANDIERRHIEMDKLLTDTLIELGYKDGVDIFERTKKWYA